MAVINPVGPNIRVDTANTVSVATTQQTPYIRVVAVGASHAHVAIATAPNMAATTADFLAVRDVPSVFSIGQVRSQPVVGVTTGTTTAFRVAEGQGSQFVRGQTVMLTDCNSRLVRAWQASALTGGAEGYVHCQQVQITGG